jgi:hypothetical protein
VNSCVNSPEDRLVGPKHVEIRRYMNKIEIVTSVGFFVSYVEEMHGTKSLKYHSNRTTVYLDATSTKTTILL